MKKTRSNIGAALDTFVGRRKELEWLEEAVTAQRLVVLVGPAGAGKTRLSRQLANQPAVRAHFEDRWFVDLSDARGAADVVDAIARIWDLQLEGTLDERIEAVVEQGGRMRRALLILDNFETVLEEAALIVLRWSTELNHCFLVTSTAGLDVRGARELAVGPLAPEAAAQLFIERAFGEADRPHTADDHEIASRIADRLDRLPLAVELAARQAEILSPAEIEAHLDSAFELLSTGPRDAPERHSSLHAMVAWGWARLDARERQIMEAAAIFEGGFTIAALAYVADLELTAVRELLLALRRKSMIATTDGPAGVTRLALLNTLGTFVRTELAERPDVLERLQLRHLRHCADLARDWAASLDRTDGERSRSALEAERANIVVALRRATVHDLDSADYTEALHLGLALQLLHDRRGVVHETPALLTTLVERGTDKPGIDLGLHARLRAACGELRRRAGDAEGAAEVAKAVEQARSANDLGALAATLLVFGEFLFVGGDRERALAAYQEAADAAASANDQKLLLDAKQSLVVAKAFLGQDQIEEHEAVHRLAVELGDAWIEATCLTNLGIRHRREGRLGQAVECFETAITRFTELGDDATAGQVMLFLGIAHLNAGAFDAASTVLERARTSLFHRGPEARHMADLALARVQVARGENDAAEQMLDEVIRETMNAGAVETETLARTERVFLACQARDEGRLRRELQAFPAVERVRSFDARQEARTLLAFAADLDRDGTPSLDALAEELRDEEPFFVAFIAVMRKIAAAVPQWPAQPLSRTDVAAEIESQLPGFDASVFPLHRWIELLRSSSAVLEVATDFSKVRPPGGAWIDLSKKGRTRAVLQALIEARVEHPGEPVTAEDLFARAWPDTNIQHDSAMSRVYTAMSEIRKMGFADVLDRTDVGYLISPPIEVEFVTE